MPDPHLPPSSGLDVSGPTHILSDSGLSLQTQFVQVCNIPSLSIVSFDHPLAEGHEKPEFANC